MRKETELGRVLADALQPEHREALVADPWRALPEAYSLTIEVLDQAPGGACGLDGTYDRARQIVSVARRASGRRMHFTLLHELGHHLLRADRGCVRHFAPLSETARSASEELIADAFATEVLLPSDQVESLLGAGTVRARAVAELFGRFPASRAACATRAAEQCPGSGYIIIAEGADVLYSAPFGEQIPFRVRRGTTQPPHAPVAQAAGCQHWQGTGALFFPRGTSTRDWNVDAVASDSYTFAVFTSERIPGATWTPPVSKAAGPSAPDVSCTDCDEVGPSWDRCSTCDGFTCAACGACPACRSTAPRARERLCPGCFQRRPLASFQDGEDLCIDQCT